MGRRGRKRQLDVEARYWELLQSGVGTVEACRMVGITRKTGYRWRAERGGLAPLELSEAARSNRYLSALERQRIATLRGQKLGVREIARRIDRDASTVSRELRRNRLAHDRDYDADLAHARARERARRPRRTRLSVNAELRAAVQGKLELEWSPEQIAGWLRATFPLLRTWHVCHETICECRCGTPAWRTARLGAGDLGVTRRRSGRCACLLVDASVGVAGAGLAHQLA
jgi:transposase, IS30 family